MNRNRSPFPALILCLAIAVGLIMDSCSNSETKTQTTEDSSAVAEKENDAKFANKKQENDAQFLVDAATFSLEEIKLGKQALIKGSTADVRDLGKMMVDEHTKALKKISDLAKTKQVTIPDSVATETTDAYNDLSKPLANDYNIAYLDRMVKQHEKAIATYEKESSDSRDQDIKEFAGASLPELRKHLDKVFDVQKKVTPKM